MRVRVVISPESAAWIIGKMADRLVEELLRLGIDAAVVSVPPEDADIVHWMSYAEVPRRAGKRSTVFITHVDDPHKTRHIQRLLDREVDMGICMSADMVRALTSWGIDHQKLWYVLPAHDGHVPPARVAISITTRIYPDGRKREHLLKRLASEVDLSLIRFEIAGEGWDGVIPALEQSGAEVRWLRQSDDYRADYQAILASMRGCDYYLYLGKDEGSLGALDAVAMGLETILTPQGYHLDLPGGITEPFDTYEDLKEIFTRLIAKKNARISGLQSWSWKTYAEEHLAVWEILLEGHQERLAELMTRNHARYRGSAATPETTSLLAGKAYYLRFLSPSRLFDATLRSRLIRPLREALRKLRHRRNG